MCNNAVIPKHDISVNFRKIVGVLFYDHPTRPIVWLVYVTGTQYRSREISKTCSVSEKSAKEWFGLVLNLSVDYVHCEWLGFFEDSLTEEVISYI